MGKEGKCAMDESLKDSNSRIGSIILATIIVILMTIMNTYMINIYASDKLLSQQQYLSLQTKPFPESNKPIINENDINLIKEVVDGKNTVNELDRVKYRITVINNKQEELNNVIIKDTIPENAIYTEEVQIGESKNYIVDANKKEIEWNIGKLQTGEKLTLEYQVTINPLYNVKESEIGTKAELTAENLEDKLESNQANVKIVKTDYTIIYQSSKKEDEILKQNSQINYNGMVTNISETKNNTPITVQLPEGVEYIEAESQKINIITGENIEKKQNIEYNKVNNTVIITEQELQTNEAVLFDIKVKIVNTDKEEIKSYCYVEDQTSEEVKNTVSKTKLIANMKEEIIDNKEIIYTIEVENIGKTIENNVLISDIIPEELNVIECTINNSIIESSQVVKVNTIIKPNEKITLKIKTTKGEKINNNIIVNDALIKTETGEEIRTNKVIYKIEEDSNLSKISINNILKEQKYRV